MPRKPTNNTKPSPEPKFTRFENLPTEKKITAFALQMVFVMTGDRGLKDLMDELDLSTQAANKSYRDGKKYLAAAFEADAKKGKSKGKANQPVLRTAYDASLVKQNLKAIFDSNRPEEDDSDSGEEEGSDEEEDEPEPVFQRSLQISSEDESDSYQLSNEEMKMLSQAYAEAKQHKGDKDKIATLRHGIYDILVTRFDSPTELIKEYAQRMGLDWVEVGRALGYRKSPNKNYFSERSIDHVV